MGLGKTNALKTNLDANTRFLLSIDPVRDGYSPEKSQALSERLPERLKAVRSVRGIALAAQAPFSAANGTVQIAVEKSPSDSSPTLERVAKETIGAGHFATLSEAMLAGREFGQRDQQIEIPADGSKTIALPIVLNESAARALFGNRNAIGRRVTEEKQSYEVVGIAHDLKNGIANEDQPAAVMYLPFTRRDFASPPAGGITVLVRSEADVDALRAVRRAIVSEDPALTDIFADSFSVSTNDPLLLVGAPSLLAALAMVSCYIPARRSAKNRSGESDSRGIADLAR